MGGGVSMLKFIKWFFLALVLIVAVFAVVVALQPSDFRVQRSKVVAAPPSAVFAQVNDFHNWQEWSPWAKLDPNATATFEGPDSGEGAVFRWAGNDEVGEGNMKITQSRPDELIRLDLEFIKPYAGKCLTEFTFRPQGEASDQTEVAWAMSGKNNFLQKAICMFMDMDKMVGADFEKGLANIKAIVEK
jgi:hypothetical protein